MGTFFQDVRLAFRTLWKSPGFTAVCVLSLALGIGANTTVFSLIDAILLPKLPVPEPERLVALYGDQEGASGRDSVFQGYMPISYPNFVDLRGKNRSLSELASWHGTYMGLTGYGEPVEVLGELVSTNYFQTFGVGPLHGRFFLPQEEGSFGQHPVAVLSHALWSQRYGSDPGIVGRKIEVNSRELTVVGVARPGFRGTQLTQQVMLWVPNGMFPLMTRPPINASFEKRAARMFFLVGRLRPGATFGSASAELNEVAAQLAEQYPEENKGQKLTVLPLREATMNPAQHKTFVRTGKLLSLIVGLLLFIACANVANLLLARASVRRKEIAVRIALGAGRRRLIRQLLTESLVLALLGAALALPVAVGSLQLLWRSRSWLRNYHGSPIFAEGSVQLGLNPRVFLFTLVVAVVTGLLFGLVPSLQTSRPEIARDLQSQPGAAPRGRRRLASRRLLVVVQVALCLVSLTGASLFLRSLRNAQAIEPGFDPQDLALASFNPGMQGYSEEQARELYSRVLERVDSLESVRSATLAEVRPLTVTILRSIHPAQQDPSKAMPSLTNVVGPNYFATLGIPLVVGRDFGPQDGTDTQPVAIINETLARQFWPGRDPVGQKLHLKGMEQDLEVVGVARDAKYVQLTEEPRPYVYFPLSQRYVAGVTLHVRVTSPASEIVPALRREIQALDAKLPVVRAEMAEDQIAAALWGPRLGAAMLSVYGLLALALALIGVYGLMAYSVNQRRHEIGIRMAVGARRTHILGLVVREGLLVAVLGVAIGLLMASGLDRLIRSLLYGIDSADLVAFATSAALLVAAALVASYFPALRAARVEPKSVMQTQ